MSHESTYKNALLFQRSAGFGASATANPTFRGAIDRSHKGKTEKVWWRKQLASRQEVLVECVTGEIYRYLIGGRQPRLRAEGANVVLSENIAYDSPRDYFENRADRPEKRARRDAWRAAFQENLEGLAMVLVSSMMLEENDLSDQNYGLALLPEAGEDDHSDETVAQKARGKTFASFIKIDHGQSLNSLRIADLAANAKGMKRMTGRAVVKYFPVGAQGAAEERKKKDRKTILASLFSKRQYALPSSFLSWSFFDFLGGVVDRDYILASEYQPSTFPLFDGRILSLFPLATAADRVATIERFEAAKYAAVAKLVFTSDEVYRTLARCAVPQDDQANLRLIVDRILRNKRAVRDAVSIDPDFFAWVYENRVAVEHAIRSSAMRMASKRNGEASERYGSLAAVEPVDASWAAAQKVGEALSKLLGDAGLQLAFVAETLRTREGVRASWGGGESVQLESLLDPTSPQARNAVSARLPRHAAIMANTLACWRTSPKHRALRTTFSMALLAHNARNADASSRRSEATTRFYAEVDDLMTALGADHAALRIVLARFRGLGEHVNLFDLAPYVGNRAAPAVVEAVGAVRNLRSQSVANVDLAPL